jgi:hypothetical protein
MPRPALGGAMGGEWEVPQGGGGGSAGNCARLSRAYSCGVQGYARASSPFPREGESSCTSSFRYARYARVSVTTLSHSCLERVRR